MSKITLSNGKELDLSIKMDLTVGSLVNIVSRNRHGGETDISKSLSELFLVNGKETPAGFWNENITVSDLRSISTVIEKQARELFNGKGTGQHHHPFLCLGYKRFVVVKGDRSHGMGVECVLWEFGQKEIVMMNPSTNQQFMNTCFLWFASIMGTESEVMKKISERPEINEETLLVLGE